MAGRRGRSQEPQQDAPAAANLDDQSPVVELEVPEEGVFDWIEEATTSDAKADRATAAYRKAAAAVAEPVEGATEEQVQQALLFRDALHAEYEGIIAPQDEPGGPDAQGAPVDPEAERQAALAAFAAGGTAGGDEPDEDTAEAAAAPAVERTGLVHEWGGETSYLVVKHSFFTTNGKNSVTAYRGDVVKIPAEAAEYGLSHGTITLLDD